MPGQRGNSGGKKGRSGRKSKAEELGLSELLTKAFPQADREKVFANLAKIAQGDNSTAAVSASSLLLAYAYGKPTEKHEVSGKSGGPITVKVVYETSESGSE